MDLTRNDILPNTLESWAKIIIGETNDSNRQQTIVLAMRWLNKSTGNKMGFQELVCAIAIEDKKRNLSKSNLYSPSHQRSRKSGVGGLLSSIFARLGKPKTALLVPEENLKDYHTATKYLNRSNRNVALSLEAVRTRLSAQSVAKGLESLIQHAQSAPRPGH